MRRELALFAGAGGGILGGHLLGWRTVCAVELDPYARDVLIARQDDGVLPPFPVWDDIGTFDGRPWRGCVDVVSGGFPCQDISAAGKGAGIEGRRSGLWSEMARIVCEVRPRCVFVENSPMLTSRGLGVVLGDLARLGFDAWWCVLGADDQGAPHRRKRIWILAYSHENGPRGSLVEGGDRSSRGGEPAGGRGAVSDPDRFGRPGRRGSMVCDSSEPDHKGPCAGRHKVAGDARWPSEPKVGRVAHGVAARVDRLRAIGNGQVPRVAAAAFVELCRRGGWALD